MIYEHSNCTINRSYCQCLFAKKITDSFIFFHYLSYFRIFLQKNDNNKHLTVKKIQVRLTVLKSNYSDAAAVCFGFSIEFSSIA